MSNYSLKINLLVEGDDVYPSNLDEAVIAEFEKMGFKIFHAYGIEEGEPYLTFLYPNKIKPPIKSD